MATKEMATSIESETDTAMMQHLPKAMLPCIILVVTFFQTQLLLPHRDFM